MNETATLINSSDIHYIMRKYYLYLTVMDMRSSLVPRVIINNYFTKLRNLIWWLFLGSVRSQSRALTVGAAEIAESRKKKVMCEYLAKYTGVTSSSEEEPTCCISTSENEERDHDHHQSQHWLPPPRNIWIWFSPQDFLTLWIVWLCWGWTYLLVWSPDHYFGTLPRSL